MAATAPVVAAARVALVAGATGLVGRAVRARLRVDKQYSAVHCVGRRLAEEWALHAFKWLIPLIPANYRPVDAGQVACALVKALQAATPDRHVLLSGELRA